MRIKKFYFKILLLLLFLILKTNVSETISYAYKITLSLIQNRKFRNAILRLLVKIYSNLPNPDYVNVVQCLIYLDEPEQVAVVLENLIRADNCLMAYQLGLDLYESATQQFLLKVKNLLKALIAVPQAMDTGDAATNSSSELSTDQIKLERLDTNESIAGTTAESKTKISDDLKMYIEKLLVILSGEITISTNMQFLIKNNHSDLLVLKTIKVN
jgi:26S proteasome regulatory subunit N2